MRKLTVFVFTVLLWTCLLFSVPDQSKEKLDNITKQIDDINDKLEKLKKEEGSILNDIYKIELQYEKAVIQNNKIKLVLRNTEGKINKKNA